MKCQDPSRRVHLTPRELADLANYVLELPVRRYGDYGNVIWPRISVVVIESWCQKTTRSQLESWCESELRDDGVLPRRRPPGTAGRISGPRFPPREIWPFIRGATLVRQVIS